MEFNVSTFALEIINFLILLWILQRLFYKPLLEILAKRKQFIDQALADAKGLQQQAEAERQQYQQQLEALEHQKQAAHDLLQQEIEQERRIKLEQLNLEVEQERRKFSLVLSREQQELQQQLEKQALQNGAHFARLLLQQAVTPQLEQKLCSMLLESLNNLPANCVSSLPTATSKKPLTIKISSAFPLSSELQTLLQAKLSTLISGTINYRCEQNPALLAGVQIDLGHWVLDANLLHDLAGFAALAHVTE